MMITENIESIFVNSCAEKNITTIKSTYLQVDQRSVWCELLYDLDEEVAEVLLNRDDVDLNHVDCHGRNIIERMSNISVLKKILNKNCTVTDGHIFNVWVYNDINKLKLLTEHGGNIFVMHDYWRRNKCSREISLYYQEFMIIFHKMAKRYNHNVINHVLEYLKK